MARIAPESTCHNLPLVRRIAQKRLQLRIAHRFKREPDRKHGQTDDIERNLHPAGSSSLQNIRQSNQKHEQPLQHIDLEKCTRNNPFPPCFTKCNITKILRLTVVAFEYMVKEPHPPKRHQQRDRRPHQRKRQPKDEQRPSENHKTNPPADVHNAIVLTHGSDDEQHRKIDQYDDCSGYHNIVSFLIDLAIFNEK